MREMWYTYWLACVEGITGDRKCELCRKNGSAEAVYYIEEKGIREQIITEKEWGILKESKKKRNWREAYQKVVDRGIQMAVRGQNNYPKRFEELAGMPYALFFIGEMPREGMPSVAVVEVMTLCHRCWIILGRIKGNMKRWIFLVCPQVLQSFSVNTKENPFDGKL